MFSRVYQGIDKVANTTASQMMSLKLDRRNGKIVLLRQSEAALYLTHWRPSQEADQLCTESEFIVAHLTANRCDQRCPSPRAPDRRRGGAASESSVALGAAALLIRATIKFYPTGRVSAFRISMRPVNDTALRIPFILTIELNVIPGFKGSHPAGQINIVGY